MPIDSAWNMYIFRDGKTVVRGSELVSHLSGALARHDAQNTSTATELMDLLLRAGELECALIDAGSAQAKLAATVTEALADGLVSGRGISISGLSARVQSIELNAEVRVAVPEGFAYYALHPLDYVDMVRGVPLQSRFSAVIGIRSIGSTLSAVVQAALRADGVHAQRITVRPTGHPYDRETVFTDPETQWIADMRSHQATFFVVDEGPGLSGSSFLSVGDALVSAGIQRGAIAFLCSRQPYAPSLTAPNAAERWPSFRAFCTKPTQHLPRQAKHYVAGGIWRANVFDSEEEWPASWLQMERLKFLSEDRKCLFKFEGFGRFGAEVHERAMHVADAGYGPRPLRREEGFGVYPWVRGRWLSSRDANPVTLHRMAAYCAFRATTISAATTSNGELEAMLGFNVREEFGIDLPQDRLTLSVERPTIADGRMLPHKWIDADGVLLKVDSASHGDDHFFPGPCDIAWDLAGAIVEWNLNAEAREGLLHNYKLHAGEDCRERIWNYVLAYSVFRTAYSRMAAAAMRGSAEEERLMRDYQRYRAQAHQFLDVPGITSRVSVPVGAPIGSKSLSGSAA
jgi:hypothetical protein